MINKRLIALALQIFAIFSIHTVVPTPVASRQLFTVYCNPLDPGTAHCSTIPQGIKIDCIASSGGLAQCLDPASNQYVNCVPYQGNQPGDAGSSAAQLACYSNSTPGARGSKFDRNVFNGSDLPDGLQESF